MHVSGLVLWLKSDEGLFTDTGGTTPVTADGQAVALWKDQSGAGNNFSQSTSGKRPLWKVNIVNGLPTLRFDGSDDVLAGPSFSSLTAGEGFIVIKPDAEPAASGNGGIWGFSNTGAAGDHYSLPADGKIYDAFGRTTTASANVNPTPSLAAWRLYNALSAPGEWTNFLDGVQLATTGTNTVSFPTSTFVGGKETSSTYLDGDIAEVIVFNKKLSTAEKSLVEAYVADRYNLSIA